jgi:hypothetical protein
MVGTPVFKMVVSSDSMKKATAISHGSSRLLEACSGGCGEAGSIGIGEVTCVWGGGIGLCERVAAAQFRENQVSLICGSISLWALASKWAKLLTEVVEG